MNPATMALLTTVPVLAAAGQKAAEAAEAAGGQGVITQYLDKGGWMMYVILAVSVIGVVVFLERAFGLFILRRLSASAFMATVLEHIEARRFRQALDACAIPTRHPLVKVVQNGILRANRREKEIERAMEKEMLAAIPGINKRVTFLGLLANTATLLGLLGTIFGLIAAFSSVAEASAAERQEALAAGISQAMYTTAFGISVAVPLLFFHHILARRSETVLTEVESGATALMVSLAGAGQASAAPSATPAAPAAPEQNGEDG